MNPQLPALIELYNFPLGQKLWIPRIRCASSQSNFRVQQESDAFGTMDPHYGFYEPNPLEDCETRTGLEWLRLILQTTIAFLTVSGNLLVIISIVVVKVLRHPRNYLILSLAVADLLVGSFVLPFKISVTEHCGTWTSGALTCHVWVTSDIMCCAASILGLTVISLDRYTAIAHPLFYRAHSTPNKAFIAIAMTWITAFLLTIPHWSYSDLHHERIGDGDLNFSVCMESHAAWYGIVGVLCIFFLPLFIMIFVYCKIGKVLRMQRAKNPMKAPQKPTSVIGGPVSSTDPDAPIEPPPCVLKARISELVQERKGCIMMGIVMGVFILCWLPFFSLTLKYAISELLGNQTKIRQSVYDLLVWFGYFNSCANPFIYTMFDRNFRYAFTELLCLRGCTLNSRIRSEMYSNQMGNSSGTNHSTISSRSVADKPPEITFPLGAHEQIKQTMHYTF